jgi:hypothetical protein
MANGNGMQGEKRHYRDIMLLGVRVVFQSDEPALLARVAAAYASWIGADGPEEDLAVYVVIESGSAPKRRESFASGTKLAVAMEAAWLEADGASGCGHAILYSDTANEALVEILNTIVLFLVAHQGRIPLHASAILLDDTAIVFAGRSGSGKSSLALAASRDGLPVLSEDTIFVQTEPRFRIWSVARAIHVFEQDAPLETGAGMRFRSGRWKKIIPIVSSRRTAEHAVLCVLARGGQASLAPMGQEEAVVQLTADPEPGYQFYEQRSVAAARALAAAGAWRLTLSSDPARAIALLRRTFARADLTGAA